MILKDLQVLDSSVESETVPAITDTLVAQLRSCCNLLGVPLDYCDQVTSDNLIEKVEYLRLVKRTASNELGTALLLAREHEDVADFDSAILAFEAFTARSSAPGFRAIAQSEISRLQRLRRS